MTRKASTNEPPGIFHHLVNQAAFIDRVVVGVRGTRRKESPSRIIGNANLAIGAQGCFYARCLPRRHSVTGNQLVFKYGVLRPYRNVCPFAITLRAAGSVVTCADLLLVLDGLMRLGFRAAISSVEVTFDTTGIPLWLFQREICTRAAVSEIGWPNGRRILYAGAATSCWQLRIYHKAHSIVRVEFILRNEFLRAHGIRRPEDLLLLKTFDLSRLAAFRAVDSSNGAALPARVRKGWQRSGLALPPEMPASIVQRVLRESRVDPSAWVVSSNREKLLRDMQANLIW